MRTPTGVFVVLGALFVIALAGCGSSQSGGGKPLGPLYPMVTSLSPSSAPAGGPAFTITVMGTNFVSSDTLTFGSIPLATTFVSSSELQGQVPASAISAPASPVVYAATSPPSSLNYGMDFTIQDPSLVGNSSFTATIINIQANDMAWDPVSQQIYVSVPGGSGSASGKISALNPVTGQLAMSQTTAAGPNHLAVSNDASYLWAGIDGHGTIQRFTLPSLTPDISIPLGAYDSYDLFSAMDLEAAPGSPHTVAAVIGIPTNPPLEYGGIFIYDDAVARPSSVPGWTPSQQPGPISAVTWNPNGDYLYGSDTETFPNNDFFVLSVGSAGVKLANTDQIQSITTSFGSPRFESATGYLYGSNGLVINPSSGSVVGSFPTNTIQGGYQGVTAMTTDGTLNIAYFIGITNWGYYQACALEAYDLTHYTYLGGAWVNCAAGPPVKLFRWGSNGLAYLLNSPGGFGNSVGLVTGAFVTSPSQ